jgi:O-acetyl-ADP-ribose deacetylase (regulator of RNase III)
MITYVEGDLFQSPAKVLVNTVNTVGVMGKGIAYQFKLFYPDMFKKYQVLCENKQFKVGQLWLHKTAHKWILNFPTKEDWRSKSRPEYIDAGLQKFVATYDEKGITSISFPLLGCGNGELDWETQVRPLMERYLKPLPIDVYIHLYRPDSTSSPEHNRTKEIRAWLHGEPQALAFSEFWEDLIQIIGAGIDLITLDQGESFAVNPAFGQEGIIIQRAKANEVLLEKERLLDLWQYMRVAGYCMGQNFPAGLDTYSGFIVSLFSRLEYLNPVVLSREDSIQQKQYGLQLIPTLRNQSILISETAKVIETR